MTSIGVCLLSGLFGCHSPRATQLEAARADQEAADRSYTYSLADVEFSYAVLLKPRQTSHAHVDLQLAPLLVQEVAGQMEGGPGADRIGALSLGEGGLPSVDGDSPAVYWQRSSVVLAGRESEQLVFVWFHVASPGSLAWQGIRLTFDRDGFPAIAEVLANDLDLSALFVNESFESAATDALGTPLEGRQHTAEQGLEVASDVVVPRVIADGPIPSGPYVYQQARSRVVTTLLCRCMASQVDDIVESPYYDLIPMDSLGSSTGALLSAYPRLQQLLGSQVSTSGRPLDAVLRFPPDW